MPWTKTKYPVSMKKLPAAVRTKAIAIANALLKENSKKKTKKMTEGVLIATAIKNAKKLVEKKVTKAKVVSKRKVKTAVKKQVLSKGKKKIKGTVPKSVKPVAAKKTSKIAGKTAESPRKRKPKVETKSEGTKTRRPKAKKVSPAIAKKHVISPMEGVVKKEIIKSPVGKIEKAPLEIPITVPETVMPGEDMHFIPEAFESNPLTTKKEMHQVENIFHNREEVAMHQENQKVKDALSSPKNARRFFRTRGNK